MYKRDECFYTRCECHHKSNSFCWWKPSWTNCFEGYIFMTLSFVSNSHQWINAVLSAMLLPLGHIFNACRSSPTDDMVFFCCVDVVLYATGFCWRCSSYSKPQFWHSSWYDSCHYSYTEWRYMVLLGRWYVCFPWFAKLLYGLRAKRRSTLLCPYFAIVSYSK